MANLFVTPQFYYIGNDHSLVLDLLVDDSGTYINDATVEATLYDSVGGEVSGQTWPLTLGYDGGGTGRYVGSVENDLSVTAGEEITARITATTVGGVVGRWDVRTKVSLRRS